MRNVVIAVNPSKDKDGSIQQIICDKLKKSFEDIKIQIFDSYEMKNYDVSSAELLIVLGGDGTLLGVARDVSTKYDIPIMGINIGNLGFLSSLDIKDLDKAIDKIKKKEFNIENRTMLCCNVDSDNINCVNTALNDIVITRGTLSRMIKINVFIDGKEYSSFKGDGLIIATPTGSTAYSFSAGGPFIYPNVDVITLTPICPHSKSMQPIVINSDSEIEIRVKSDSDESYITFDGQKYFSIEDKTIIKIKKSETYAKILLFDDYDYFKVLRTKILNQ